jgi:hypothetical protein
MVDIESVSGKGRCPSKALFTIRQVIVKSVAFGQPLFICLGSAKGKGICVPRHAVAHFGCVLCTHEDYRVADGYDTYGHSSGCSYVGGLVSEWFDASGGSWQGCVTAPLLCHFLHGLRGSAGNR